MTEPVESAVRWRGGPRWKFWIGGLLIVAAVVYLIASSTSAAAQYYLTVDELNAEPSVAQGRDLKISGAVDGETISYDAATLTLRFAIANVPGDLDQIEKAGAGGGAAPGRERSAGQPADGGIRRAETGPAAA